MSSIRHRVAELLQHTKIPKLAIVLRVIQAVADHETVLDGEAHEVAPHLHFAAAGLVEERGHARFKNTDHFGGELKYFSDCILAERDPEPDGEEGYADVRVLDGIVRALETGGSVTLEPFARSRRIDTEAQEQTLPAVSSPPLVAASNPGRGKDRVPKN